MRVIIDRFEEDFAVVELDGKMLNAPRALFAEAREGDTVELTVIPRSSDLSKHDMDDIEETKRRLEENVLSFLKKNKTPEHKESDEAAAMFRKLRQKQKKQ